MTNKALSSLIGGALGDALGYSREFTNLDGILDALPGRDWRNADFTNAPNANTWDLDGKAMISDDTQMTIATGRALLSADFFSDSVQSMGEALSAAYMAWSIHPDNFRAPGNACMRATSNMIRGLHWQDATDITTMGCGANMRVAPIALSDVGPRTARDIAMLSAAITHAHPAALAATALTADAIRAVSEGHTGRGLLDYLIHVAVSGMAGYYPHWVLGDLWESSEYGSPEAYMTAGYSVCVKLLDRVKAVIDTGWAGETDPCTITGEAWIAPSAFAGAVLCAVGLWDSPVSVLRRAAVSNGDSDSLAAIAGNIRGAAGVEWPDTWVNGLEIAPVLELHKIAKGL